MRGSHSFGCDLVGAERVATPGRRDVKDLTEAADRMLDTLAAEEHTELGGEWSATFPARRIVVISGRATVPRLGSQIGHALSGPAEPRTWTAEGRCWLGLRVGRQASAAPPSTRSRRTSRGVVGTWPTK
jgi:hypothetical protein